MMNFFLRLIVAFYLFFSCGTASAWYDFYVWYIPFCENDWCYYGDCKHGGVRGIDFLCGSCLDTTFYVPSPVATQINGGSNTYTAPQINLSTYFLNNGLVGCGVGGSSTNITAAANTRVSGSMGTISIAESTVKATSSPCCSSGVTPGYPLGSIPSYNNHNGQGGCSIPNHDSTFGPNSDQCSDCSCSNASLLSSNYGCSTVKTLSLLCKENVPIPSVCIDKITIYMGAPDHGALPYSSLNNLSWCYPAPLAPQPPEMCKCTLPAAPHPAYAFMVCGTFDSPSVSADPNSGTTNNCAPQYISPNGAGSGPVSTYNRPYARVLISNLEEIGNWESPPSVSTTDFLYCGSNPDSTHFKGLCSGSDCSGSEQDCIKNQSSTNVISKYINDQNMADANSFPVIYVYFPSNQSGPPPAPSGPSNTTFSNNPSGSTSISRIGVNNAQFLDISFNFAALGASSNSNCTLSQLGTIDPVSCAGSNLVGIQSVGLVNNQPYTRYFRTYLPDSCSPGNHPGECPQFCVAEIFKDGQGLPYSLGCFTRPAPSTFSISECQKNSPVGNKCDDYIGDYNSNSNWCIDITIEGSVTRSCGKNNLSTIQVIGGQSQPLPPIITDINNNQPPLGSTTTPYPQYCSNANNPYNFSSCPTGLFFYPYTPSGQKNQQYFFRNATAVCGEIPSLPFCPTGCQQSSSCTSANNQSGCNANQLIEFGCNCVSAQQNYCLQTRKINDNSCPASLMSSSRPSDRTNPNAATISTYHPDDLIQLAPWDMNPSGQSPSSGSALRGRTSMEMGLCSPLVPWDPVDCCQMFGPDSDLARDYNKKNFVTPNGITVEDFYNACQAFTCDFVTVTQDSLNSEVSSANLNDLFYIRNMGINIYNSCITGQAPVLPDPSFFSSNNKLSDFVSSAVSPIKKITDIYGTGVLCSFFQPGSTSTNNGGPASCTPNTVITGGTNNTTKATCGALAPAFYDGSQLQAAKSNYAYCQSPPSSLNTTKGLYPSSQVSRSNVCGQSYSSCTASKCPSF